MNLLLRKILINDIFYLIVIICCLFIFLLNTNKQHNKIDSSKEFLVETIKKKDDIAKLTLKSGSNKIMCNYYINNINNEITVKKTLEGQKILIDAKITKVNSNTIFNGFNYKNYLKSKNIYNSCTINKIIIKDKRVNPFYKVKNYINKKIAKNKNKDYMYTFILGNKDYLIYR